MPERPIPTTRMDRFDSLDAAPAGWYAIARQRELSTRRPLQRWLFDTPVALMAGPRGPVALVDRCPHRGAPLSAGRIDQGRLRCPYHGWSFDVDGRLARVPGLDGEPPPVAVRALPTAVRLGLVFVWLGASRGDEAGPAAGADEPAAEGPDGGPYVHPQMATMGWWQALAGRAQAGWADVAENILDPTHTAFVHPGLLRAGRGDRPTQVTVTASAGGVVEARYRGEGEVQGVLPVLLREQARPLAVGRFVAPSVAEVEFHGPRGLRLVFSGYLRPAKAGWIEGYGVFGLPGPRPWAWLQWALLLPWAWRVYRQDRRMLALTSAHWPGDGSSARRIGPLDLMRPQIEALLAGREPPAARAPVERTLWL